MKKAFKKQIEHELHQLIEKALSEHNSRAIDKTKKAIKEASKIVAKKFAKTVKNLSDKPTVKAKEASQKPQPAKNVASKTMTTKKVSHAHSSNGVSRYAKSKAVVSGAAKRKAASHTVHHS